MTKPHCMIIVRYILPAIRAKLAMKLVEKRGFRSKEAAEMLGLTQAAISQYMNSKRGQQGIKLIESSKNAEAVIDELVEKIVDGDFDFDLEVEYVCMICDILRREKVIPSNLT
jgi:hypothetical protein